MLSSAGFPRFPISLGVRIRVLVPACKALHPLALLISPASSPALSLALNSTTWPPRRPALRLLLGL